MDPESFIVQAPVGWGLEVHYILPTFLVNLEPVHYMTRTLATGGRKEGRLSSWTYVDFGHEPAPGSV